MSSESVADVAQLSFSEFTVATSPEKLRNLVGGVPTCLADFIKAWAKAGYGVRACNGEYANFLIAIIAISELWRDDPGVVDYVSDHDEVTGQRQIVKRRVESVFGDKGLGQEILDRDFFVRQTSHEFHGGRSLFP